MERYFTYFFVLLFLNSCSLAQENILSDSTKQDTVQSSDSSLLFDESVIEYPNNYSELELNTINYNYSQSKVKVENIRKQLLETYKSKVTTSEKEAFLDSASQIFTNLLLNDIIPHWYGTQWDFNGYTAKPKQGYIACGYFVSTTLRDMGININRYTMAQQSASNEGKSIMFAEQNRIIRHFSEHNQIFEELQKTKEGLYFVGLDNHVGFILVESNKQYFIHSDFYSGRVRKELIENSVGFSSSNYHIIRITGNTQLMLRWINNTPIYIYKD